MPGRYHDGYGVPWVGIILMCLLLLLLVGLVVTLVVWAVTRQPSQTPSSPSAGAPPAGSARAILDERFARGDIDEDEYRRRRVMLDGG